MLSLLSLLRCLFVLFGCVVSPAAEPRDGSSLSCKGGTIYFSAHPADCLLFQNPDLLYDLYVYKCTTTVVFTSGARGSSGNRSALLERGLEDAHGLMAGFPKIEVKRTESRVRIGEYEVQSWTFHEEDKERRAQILFLRLPDSAASGEAYTTNGNDTLLNLYTGAIKNITSTDGTSEYSLEALKDLIATILLAKVPQKVRVLNHRAPLPPKRGKIVDHSDHVVVSRLVKEIIETENITTSLEGYAGNFANKFVANLNTSEPAFRRKADAFFKYAKHDSLMCQNLDECKDRSKQDKVEDDRDEDFRHVARYLEREYYVL